MKLYTLGTSHGATEVGRACSANLLAVGGNYYLFDCGGNTEGKMTDMGLPIDRVRATFITHMHEDHAGTLSSIAKRFSDYHPDAPALPVYLPEQTGIDAFGGWLSALHIAYRDRVLLRLIHVGRIYEDDHISVTAVRTEHIKKGAFPSFAFLVEAEGKRFLYTGDLSGDFHDYPAVLLEQDFDAVLCELVHFKVERNLGTIAKTKTKRMIFTHLSPRNIPLVRSVEKELPFPIAIAEDGACFEI